MVQEAIDPPLGDGELVVRLATGDQVHDPSGLCNGYTLPRGWQLGTNEH